MMMHIAYSPFFNKIYKFLSLFTQNIGFALYRPTCFCFPYFDHDAFMHHALRVLDASALEMYKIRKNLMDNPPSEILTSVDCFFWQRLCQFPLFHWSSLW